jgi:hypothetical protein
MKIEPDMKTMSRYLRMLALVAALAELAITPQSNAAQLAPPSSAVTPRSANELEKLVAPLALYPDPLIAVMLSASVYPVDIVYAARFVANSSNVAKLEDQPWDMNVKAVARFPLVIQKMNDELSWTVELGQAFTQEPLELMDAIQVLRAKAQSVGTLQTTPQQVVTVSQAVVERTYEARIIYVTNTVVQIMPANPEVIYVPEYNSTVIYAPPPSYVYNPGTPLIHFGAGIVAGAVIANSNPDWYYGGVYYGRGRAPVWVGIGHGPFFPPPSYYWPPRHYPGHRPPPFSNHPRPPGNHPRPPANQPPQPPGNQPRPPVNQPPRPGYQPPPGNRPGPLGKHPPRLAQTASPANCHSDVAPMAHLTWN